MAKLLEEVGSNVDAILLDISMPGLSGIESEANKDKWNQDPDPIVSIYPKNNMPSGIKAALPFLNKESANEELLPRSQDIIRQKYISSIIADKLVESLGEIREIPAMNSSQTVKCKCCMK